MIRSLALALHNYSCADNADLRHRKQRFEYLYKLALRIAILNDNARINPSVLAATRLKTQQTSLKMGLEAIALHSGEQNILEIMISHSNRSDVTSVLEYAIAACGMTSIVQEEHHSFSLMRMASFLGQDYLESARTWLVARLQKRKLPNGILVLPGELPDVIRMLAIQKPALENALRHAGHSLSAQALSGCPEESIAQAKRCFGKIGAWALEEDAAHFRNKALGDEITMAQNTLLALIQDLESRDSLMVANDNEIEVEQDFIIKFSKMILDLNPDIIRRACAVAESSLVAIAMQAMGPEAHEKILQSISARGRRRIFSSIDPADPLPRSEIYVAGKSFAATLFEIAANLRAPEDVLKSITDIKHWENIP